MKKPSQNVGPRWATRLLRWLLAPHRLDELEDDLDELFQQRVREVGLRKARWRYVKDMVSLMRPSLMKRQPTSEYPNPATTTMLRNYLKIAFRNLAKNRVYSFINIFGLATGMAVALLIGLWIYDELSYDRQSKNYDRIAQVWQFVKFDAEKSSYNVMPIPLAGEIRSNYPDFEAVSLSVQRNVVLASGDTKIAKTGDYVEPMFTKIFSLNILAGTDAGLTDVNSILLSESVAKAFFGSENPVNKLLKLGNKQDVKVVGVYEDFPQNSTFEDVSFLAPWKLFLATDNDVKQAQDQWDNNQLQSICPAQTGGRFRSGVRKNQRYSDETR